MMWVKVIYAMNSFSAENEKMSEMESAGKIGSI
jgi:hypothetical protein